MRAAWRFVIVLGAACGSAGAGEPPVVTCQKGDVPEGEFESGNGCGIPVDFYNGGCNSVPEFFTSIECGDTVCGSVAFDGTVRDTDWYAIKAFGPTLITWTMEQAAFDWQLFIVDVSAGCDGAPVVAQASGGAGASGSAQVVLCRAGNYALVVGPQFAGVVDCPSAYRASVSCEKWIFPEFGYDCASAIALDVPSTSSGSTGGTECNPRPFACGTSLDGSGLWYSVQGTGTTITASLCTGTDYDSKLFVYCGDCDHLFCVTGDDDSCGPGGASRVSFCAALGQTYRILVSGAGQAQGSFTLDVSDDGVACDGAARCEPIVVTCQKGDVVEGEFEATGGCGIPVDTFNGWCNSVPEVASAIECGQTICGSAAWDGFTRDTDWYIITVSEPTVLTWSLLEASFEWSIFFMDSGECAAPVEHPHATGSAGESGSIWGTVQPGTYVMFVAPVFADPVPCPSGYRVSLSCAASCTVDKCDKEFSVIENEANCGLPVDTVNGGCNSVPPVFSSVYCPGDYAYPSCGTVASDGVNRDTDWYVFTQERDCELSYSFEIAADFPFVAGYIEWQPGFEGSGDCARITGLLNPSITGAGDCTPQYLEFNAGRGTHWLFIAPQLGGDVPCAPGGHNRYTITCYGGGGGGGGDCNENCISDSKDIASGFSKDCFDYSGPASTMGGHNGIPDECECVADWNRDGISNSTDVSDFISTYFADQTTHRLNADVNCDGVSNSTDVSDFINIWFAAHAGQTPFAGCTI